MRKRSTESIKENKLEKSFGKKFFSSFILAVMLVMILGGLSNLLVENMFFMETEGEFTTTEAVNYSLDDMFFDEDIYNETILEKPEFVPGEFIVKFRSDIDINISKSSGGVVKVGYEDIDVLNEEYITTSIEKVFEYAKKGVDLNLSNIYKFTFLDKANVSLILEDYRKVDGIEYIEPNYIFYICSEPNDAYFDQQWALNQSNDCDIDAPEAWDINTGSSNIVVAVIDTGVDWDHPDLADNIWNNTDEVLNGLDDDNNGFIDDIRGWDFYNNDSNPMDDNGHGTHCAGIIGAIGNNTLGVAGVCWNVSIMPLKAFSSGGYGDTDDLANAIYYAVDNGADIISMSWGSIYSSNLIGDALNYAYNNGVVLVAAAGNFFMDLESYPAAYDIVIAVAATDEADSCAWFSSFGSWVDVAAPGYNILSTLPNGEYGYKNGTSMACPYVAGLIGLILSKNANFTPDEIKTILKSTTNDVSSSRYIGVGRINAYNALQRNSSLIANLNSSLDGMYLGGIVNITGTANGTNFENYSVYYGPGIYPTEWVQINNSTMAVNDSLLAIWNVDLVNNTTLYYTVRLIVIDTNNLTSVDETLVLIDHTLQEGWPIEAGFYFMSSPNFADIDNDGLPEIIAVTNDGWLYVLNHDGSLVDGWPKLIGSESTISPLFASSPLVEDIDGDGDLEIVIGRILHKPRIYAFHHNGTAVDGWPVNSNSIYGSPTSSNLEGDLRIVAEGKSQMYFLRSDGTYLKRVISRGEQSPAVADINNDLSEDIVIPMRNKLTVFNQFNHDIITCPGWPKYYFDAMGSPVLADMDRDGDLEVIMGGREIHNNGILSNGVIYIYHHNGSNLTGWPKVFPNYSFCSWNNAVVGDVDKDCELEVVTTLHKVNVSDEEVLDNMVAILDSEGNVLQGWPVVLSNSTFGSFSPLLSAPLIVNIDDDPDMEIIIVEFGFLDHYVYKIYALNHNGTIVEGWPKYMKGNRYVDGFWCNWIVGVYPSPGVCDLDGDGDTELVLTSWDGYIYVWDLNGSYDTDNIEWGMFRGNTRHTGLYQDNMLQTSTNVSPDFINETANLTITSSHFMSVPPTVHVTFPDNSTQKISMSSIGNLSWVGNYSIEQNGKYLISASGSDTLLNSFESMVISVLQEINTTQWQRKEINITGVNVTLEVLTNINITSAPLMVTKTVEKPTIVSPGEKLIPLHFIKIDAGNALNDTAVIEVNISTYYNESRIQRGIDESSLLLYCYNESSNVWEAIQPPKYYGGINTEENYVWGNFTHLSSFGILGSYETFIPFELPLTWTNNENNDETTIIIHPFASIEVDELDEQDSGLGPNNNFNAWLDAGLSGDYEQLTVDARPPARGINWDVKAVYASVGNLDVNISWDTNVTQQLHESLFLVDGNTQIDMKTQDNYSFTLPGYTPPHSLQIVYGPTFITDPHSCWNLIGIPFNRSVELDDLLIVYNDTTCTWNEAVDNGLIYPGVYTVNRTTGTYEVVDLLKPGYGYWLRSYYDIQLWIEGINSVEESCTNVSARWNLIASPTETSTPLDNLVIFHKGTQYSWNEAIDQGLVYHWVYTVNRTTGTYEVVDLLKPGYGYWLLSYSDIQICFSGSNSLQLLGADLGYPFELPLTWITQENPNNPDLTTIMIRQNANEEDYWDQKDPGAPSGIKFNAWLQKYNREFIRDTRPIANSTTWEIQAFYESFGNLNVNISWDINLTQQLSDGESLFLIDNETKLDMKNHGNYSFTLGGLSPYSMQIIYLINDTLPPEISNIQAIPSVQYVGDFVNITCTITDNIAVDEVKITIEDPEGNPRNVTMANIIDTNIYYYNTTYDLKGTYHYFIWTNDPLNNQNTSILHQFIIRNPPTTTKTSTEETPEFMNENETKKEGNATKDQIEKQYNITLNQNFYANDTDRDGEVDTFTDPNGVLTSVHNTTIDGNISFLISVDNDDIPEFFWDTEADTITPVAHIIGSITDTVIDTENETITITVSIEKTNWTYIEVTDQHLDIPDLTVRRSDGTIIPEERIWRENGKTYVLDDPAEEYEFIYGYLILEPTFDPPGGAIFDVSRPTINITYNETVTVIEATLNDELINFTTVDNITFTYTPEANLTDGDYTLSITVKDMDNNTRTDNATYTIKLPVVKPPAGFPWIEVAVIIVLIAIIFGALTTFLYKKHEKESIKEFAPIDRKVTTTKEPARDYDKEMKTLKDDVSRIETKVDQIVKGQGVPPVRKKEKNLLSLIVKKKRQKRKRCL